MWQWKKVTRVGVSSSYHCVAEDSRIPRMTLVINPLQALLHPQTRRNYPAWIVNPQHQLLRIRLFWWIDLELWISIFQLIQSFNWWVSLLQKFESAVLFIGFEKLGLELDNCGRTTKNAYCRICSLWDSPVFFRIQKLDLRFWVYLTKPRGKQPVSPGFIQGITECGAFKPQGLSGCWSRSIYYLPAQRLWKTCLSWDPCVNCTDKT
jgi:hypothetical protein